MGVSCWVYYVPYQENVEQAFQALRQNLFETDGAFDDYVPRPQTIEEGLERSEGSGTATAMDLFSVSTQPQGYDVVPLEASVIHHLLTQKEPTRAVVEALVFQDAFWSHIDWEEFASRPYIFVETRLFLRSKPSKDELVEMLLRKEEIWMDFHLLIVSRIEAMAKRTADIIPFSEPERVRLFGTEKPTRADLEPMLDEIWRQLGWTGVYVILYQDDVPHEIAFVGASGD